MMVLGLMGCIFYLSSQTATDSRALSQTVLEVLREWIRFFTSWMPPAGKLGSRYWVVSIRKWAHFTIYLVLGLVSYGALPRGWSARKRMTWVISLCFVYAITDELHQLLVPGRACEMRDVLIDTLGSGVGISIGYFIKG